MEIHYVEEPVPDYLQTAVDTVLLINEKVDFCLAKINSVYLKIVFLGLFLFFKSIFGRYELNTVYTTISASVLICFPS